MSRIKFPMSTANTEIWGGNDHEVGPWLQVYDLRFVGHPGDPEGEGIVLDFDSKFGFNRNLIGYTNEELTIDRDGKILLEKTEIFIQSLQNG